MGVEGGGGEKGHVAAAMRDPLFGCFRIAETLGRKRIMVHQSLIDTVLTELCTRSSTDFCSTMKCQV